MKAKKKEGLSCLFEIAGQKKGLLVLAGLLSAGSAVCMLVPYWAIYEILKELLSHGGNPPGADGEAVIRWGWTAFGGLVGGLVLLYLIIKWVKRAFLEVKMYGHIAIISLDI